MLNVVGNLLLGLGRAPSPWRNRGLGVALRRMGLLLWVPLKKTMFVKIMRMAKLGMRIQQFFHGSGPTFNRNEEKIYLYFR